MSTHNVALTVASYASDGAARRDLDGLVSARGSGSRRHLALAVLSKAPDGALSIDRSAGIEPEGSLGGALLGAALIVLAAPVGIALLPAVVSAPRGWALVTALVSHYWQHVPQETLRRMSAMLEGAPVGVAIVAVDLSGEDISVHLSEATTTIDADNTTAEWDVDLNRAIDDC